MKLTLIDQISLKSSSWSGGTTTELFIFPQSANYQKRDFLFRLSTATVEVEESTFTSLPGISRKLMILSGSIVINHKGHYSKQLNKFDIDEFDGNWETSSVGKCTDFNLMTKGSTKGVLQALSVEKDQFALHEVNEQKDWIFIYLFTGNVSIEIANKNVTLNNGDFLAIESPEECEINIKGIEISELILAQVSY
jgi:environmental stress-induced protein Ves